MFKRRIMRFLKIMLMMSAIQITFQPKTTRRIAATILPSCNLVRKPQIKFVMGIIVKIKLTMYPRPK